MSKLALSDQPIVVAIGGNSLLSAGQEGTIEEQRDNSQKTCSVLASVVKAGHRLILTHGNGPQVGNVLLRVELAAEHVYRLPLDICDSDTQGGIGYMLQQILGNELELLNLPRKVATVVTQVEVDERDPAFGTPTKPIGNFMTPQEAIQKENQFGWTVARIDSRGYRRVVPSPRPIRIVELDAIKAVYEAGNVVICVGGGGVPVVRKNGRLTGCEAIIDKDLATALLAREMAAETIVITTSVPKVLLDYELPTERALDRMTLSEAERHLDDGQFPPGSMGPKIRSVISFLKNGGKRAIITDPDNLHTAIEGDAGTWIVPDSEA